MSPLSTDPEKRGRQLANLNRAGGPPGNQRARKHGAYAQIAQEELEEKSLEIFDAIAQDVPVREVDGGLPAADSLVIRMLAEAMIRRERCRVEELRHGLEIASGPYQGRLRGVVEFGLRLDAQVLEMAKELGLTPASRAKLGLDLVRASRFDLAREWAEDADAEAEVIEDA